MELSIAAISDLHGRLPKRVPACDVLLIAGDICPLTGHHPIRQGMWLENTFVPWLESLDAKRVFMCWGNHDFIGERAPSLVPAAMNQGRFRVLTDEGAEYCGYKFWGIPWTLRFMDWAFNLDEPYLAERFAAMPADTDVLITHGPPFGYGDLTAERVRVGSPSLLAALSASHSPRLAVFGHIHEGRGAWSFNENCWAANVTQVNRNYEPIHKPYQFTLSKEACVMAG